MHQYLAIAEAMHIFRRYGLNPPLSMEVDGDTFDKVLYSMSTVDGDTSSYQVDEDTLVVSEITVRRSARENTTE